MAFVAGHSLLTFLLLLLLFAISSPHVHARESRAFGKVTREELPTETVALPEETPAVQVEKAARLGKETMYGYSYNSHDDAAGFSSSFPPNTKPNAEYGSYEKKRESNAMYRPNYGRRKDQYGMSDTRFLENGRYFYDVNAERGYGAYAGIGVGGGADHHGYGAYSNSEGSNKEGEEEYVP